jgi:D-alanyl-lipoteichoic acid acyltransferase DltB (MBOAT superfamily)
MILRGLVSLTVVDLFSGIFWLAVLVSVAVLSPVTSGRARQIVLAAVNVGFLSLLLRERVLLVVAFVFGLSGLLRFVRRAGTPLFIAVIVTALATLALHKLPSSAVGPLRAVNPVLSAIGFSYVFLRIIEVLRGVHEGRHVPPGPVALFNYLLPFHMLAAGPIQSYDEFVAQPVVPPPLAVSDVLEGVERCASGMFKKFVIAFVIERLFLTRFVVGGWYRFFEVQAYAAWFYVDFSAYSDVAVGIGKLLGVATPENFDRPYLARNMIDFWERWHISLSKWIRRNLFIPMQLLLVRRSEGKHQLLIASCSLAVSFLLCGLWHGASLPFLLWGGVHGLGVMVANLYRHFLNKRLGKAAVMAYLEHRLIRIVATLLTIEYVSLSLMIVGWHWEI